MILEIAYCVHILGDYTTSNTAALLDLREIREALEKNLSQDYWGYGEGDSKKGDNKMTELIDKLRLEDTAESMLSFLKKEIPVLVEGSPKIRAALR